MKKTLSAFLSAALLVTFITPVSAAGTPSLKEEVVYGLLGSDGGVSNLYVVNIFGGGEITDYGSYTEVKNLTTSEKIKQSGDEITISTAADKLYYQGTLVSKELPWNIAIRYRLDGQDLSGPDLAGKNGELEINIEVVENSTVNRTFYENYALQITLGLDSGLCGNITAKGATIAEAGGKKQLSYTVLPGKGADISVTADVHDFTMDAITINGIKLSLDMDIDYGVFSGQISQLTDAIKELDDGAGELLAGAISLSDGMKAYLSGLDGFKNGLSEFSDGVKDFSGGASSLREGLSELKKQNQTLVNGALSIQQSVFDSANSQLSAMVPGLPVLTSENYDSVLADMPALSALKSQLDGAVAFTEGLKSYTEGVSQLAAGASDLAGGTAQLQNPASALPSSAAELYNAGAALDTAIKGLREGLSSYKNGTAMLQEETSGMNSLITKTIEDMLESISGGGNSVISFVSDQNTNITSVQFVLKTEAIEIKEGDTAVAEQSVTLHFWQKLLKLFGLL